MTIAARSLTHHNAISTEPPLPNLLMPATDFWKEAESITGGLEHGVGDQNHHLRVPSAEAKKQDSRFLETKHDVTLQLPPIAVLSAGISTGQAAAPDQQGNATSASRKSLLEPRQCMRAAIRPQQRTP